MKNFLLSAICATAFSPMFAQTAYLKCDFSEGIPQGFSLIDVDRLEPSTDMSARGFDIGKPWIMLEEDNGNKAAVSTSWYRKAGTSDDWMITSPVTINSADAIVSWRTKAGDPEYRDGYSVYISETASTPDAFKALIPVYAVSNEKAEWTEHEVSLSEFAGKTVRVAFVNNTKDRHTLWLDDLFIGVPAVLRIESTIPRVLNFDTNIPVSGIVTNVSPRDVNGFTVSFRFGDGETMEYKSDKTVPAGKSMQFNFVSKTRIERNQTFPYELTALAGEDASSVSGKVTCLFRRIVAEEVTGTWCGYCIRGIVAMNNMKEQHPESFLGIAVHASSPTWEDPMDFADYTNYLFSSMGMSGYPHATVNRRKMQTGDPANIPIFYTQLLDRDLPAGLSIEVESVDKNSREANIHTDVYFVDDMPELDYSLAYVLIENNVHKDAIIGEDGKPQPFNGYEQSNYYTGASGMGDFGNLPKIVPGAEMTYQDVARAFWGDNFEGIKGSLPAEVKADIPYTHNYTVTLPDNVLNDENTELVALLINNKTGEIINADVTPLRAFFSGIDNVAVTSEIRVKRFVDSLVITAGDAIDAIFMYGIDGSQVCSANPGLSEFTLDTTGLGGIYILKVVSGSSVITKKISL